MLRLYETLVRPKLEYYVQARRPYLGKDIDLFKKVQKRASRLIITVSHTSTTSPVNQPVCMSVYVLGTRVRCPKTAGPIEMPFSELIHATVGGDICELTSPRVGNKRVGIMINRHFKTRQIIEICREDAQRRQKHKPSVKRNSFQHQSEVSEWQIRVIGRYSK